MCCMSMIEMLRNKIDRLERELRHLRHILERRYHLLSALDQSALSFRQHEMIDSRGVEIALERHYVEQAVDEAYRELWSHAPKLDRRPSLDDIALWPDGTWATLDDVQRGELAHMSDDYEVISIDDTERLIATGIAEELDIA